MLEKPVEMFDRDHEWSALTRFVVDEQPGATLGVVSGRRRQGKTFLLDAVCRAAGGFYFGATEASNAESLRRISAALTEHSQPASPYHFANWFEAVDALLALGNERPTPVVIDEFPYLARANPELPSIIQEAFRPLREQRTSSRSRLLLCGSALSFMGKLLSGNAPLRGRAGLELIIRTLDHKLAAEFWEITDPRLAVQVNAIVGGTPAYRREFTRGDTPANVDDFDTLLRTWLSVMAGPGVSAEKVERARAAYARDVAVLSPAEIASVIESGGFERPVQFFQAGLLHAWCSRRRSEHLSES
jgi:uncharacterized protein